MSTLYSTISVSPAPPSWRRRLLKLESALGTFWAILIAIGFICLIAVTAESLPGANLGAYAIWLLFVIAWCVLEVPFLWRVVTAARNDEVPVALYAAARQPLRHILLRPFIALWWLMHFGFGLGLAFLTEVLHEPSERQPWLATGVTFFLVLCYGYAANIFLIHAVSSLTRSRLVQFVWDWRGLFDVGMVVAGIIFLVAR
jgi:hypothetical protein